MSFRLSKGFRVALPGAGLAAVGFFLPLTTLSGGDWSTMLSGWEFASGLRVLGETVVPGRSPLFLVLFANLGVFTLAGFAWQRGHATRLWDGAALIGVALVALVALLASGGDVSTPGLYGPETLYPIETLPGFWSILLGDVVVIVGGVMNLRRSGPTSR